MAMAIARNIRKFSDKWIQLRSVDLRSDSDGSGFGRIQDSSTCRNSVGWCDQNTFQPTIPQPIRRKRRAGDRVVTKSDVGRDVRREGALWGIPRKRALFKIVSPLGVMWRRPSWGGLRMTSIQRWPIPGVSRGGAVSESRTV